MINLQKPILGTEQVVSWHGLHFADRKPWSSLKHMTENILTVEQFRLLVSFRPVSVLQLPYKQVFFLFVFLHLPLNFNLVSLSKFALVNISCYRLLHND